MRLTQLQAAELDTTLLVKGLDTLTQKALARHPSRLFRLAMFHERLGIDYAPTSEVVLNMSGSCCATKLPGTLLNGCGSMPLVRLKSACLR